MTPMLTNLHAFAGWKQSPCIAPQTTEIPSADWVMIDHESEDEAIGNSDEQAIARAFGYLDALRKATKAKLGWYGWPYPNNEDDIPRLAQAFDALLLEADWIAPCCYATGDGRAFDRAKLCRSCLQWAGASKKPCIGVVCPGLLNSERIATDAEIAEQVHAARTVGASSIYVWSSMDYHVWASTVNVDQGHPAYQQMHRSRATLMGKWGFSVPAWTPEAVGLEYRNKSRDILTAFARAWRKETRK